jgi:hypothetical protein
MIAPMTYDIIQFIYVLHIYTAAVFAHYRQTSSHVSARAESFHLIPGHRLQRLGLFGGDGPRAELEFIIDRPPGPCVRSRPVDPNGGRAFLEPGRSGVGGW